MSKKICVCCNREIDSLEEHFAGEDGSFYCLDCANLYLSFSNYGYYDTREDYGDPDFWLDDDLSDITLYHYVEVSK